MTTLSLPRPAAELTEYAHHSARLRANQARVGAWLRALDLDSVDQLFKAIGGRHGQATAMLLTEHQRGIALATTLLVGGKTVMLTSVARHAPVDSIEERFQITLDAFLSCALPRVKPAHKFVDAQLYWITLRTVTKLLHGLRPILANLPFDCRDLAGNDVAADVDTYLFADVLLDWALKKNILTEFDHRALSIRFGGSTALPVREVAAHLSISEDKLESRLRRALARLREAVVTDRDDLDRVCIEARWPTSVDAQSANAAAAMDQNDMAA